MFRKDSALRPVARYLSRGARLSPGGQVARRRINSSLWACGNLSSSQSRLVGSPTQQGLCQSANLVVQSESSLRASSSWRRYLSSSRISLADQSKAPWGNTPATPSSSSNIYPSKTYSGMPLNTTPNDPMGQTKRESNDLYRQNDKDFKPPPEDWNFAGWSVIGTRIAQIAAGLTVALGLGGYLAVSYGNDEEKIEEVKEKAEQAVKTMDASKLTSVDKADIEQLGPKEANEELVSLQMITDQDFDDKDNLFVFVVGQEKWFQDPTFKVQVKKLMKVAKEIYPKISFYYTVQEQVLESTDISRQVKFTTYKGHRKQQFTWDFSENPDLELEKQYEPTYRDLWKKKQTAESHNYQILQDITKFYEFQSQDNFDIVEAGVQTISGNQFKNFVIEDSHEYPVLLQLYEETCFLCFLMRPMIQSLTKDKSYGMPLRVMRFNVEANDFPDDLPMARGTPTFVLYKSGKAVKWSEFKPNDFIAKLQHEFPKFTPEQASKMNILAENVQKRFQMFTALVMWQLELRKIEDELRFSNEMEYDVDELIKRGTHSKDDGFNELVAQLMSDDMKRTDTLEENLAWLEQEIEDIEKDVSLMGMMLGKIIEEKEKRKENANGSFRTENGEGEAPIPDSASPNPGASGSPASSTSTPPPADAQPSQENVFTADQESPMKSDAGADDLGANGVGAVKARAE